MMLEQWDLNRSQTSQRGKGLWNLLLPLDGGGNLTVGEMVFSLQSGRVFLLGEGIFPQLTGIVPPEYKLFSFPLGDLCKFSSDQTDFSVLVSGDVQCFLLTSGQKKELLRLLEGIGENDGSFGSDLKRSMKILDVLLYLFPFWEPRDLAGGQLRESSRVTPILEYIQENLSEPLSLEQIAAKFFISKTYLCRLFKSSTGLSVVEYLIGERIARACLLLEQGYSVQKVGELCGFSDYSHFIRTFRKWKGVSPGKYGKAYLLEHNL